MFRGHQQIVFVTFSVILTAKVFPLPHPRLWPSHIKNQLWCTENLYRKAPYRSSHRRCSVKKGVFFRNFANFSGKHLCWSLFLRASNFIKKRLQHRCFPAKFAKFLKTSILKNIWERLLLSLIM